MSGGTYRGGTLEGLGGQIEVDPYNISAGTIDPCLEDCCRREVESNRRYNALQSTLRRHDIVAMTERRRRNLVTMPQESDGWEGCRCCYDPNSDGGEYRALIEYKQNHPVTRNNNNENDDPALKVENDAYCSFLKGNDNTNGDKDEEDSDDDEFDYLLDEDFGNSPTGGGEVSSELKLLEDQRRAELELQILTRQVALQHGYGTHRQLHPARVLKAAGFSSSGVSSSRQPPPAVVLHLVDPDSVTSATLDYFLETQLATKYPGTVFVRSGGRSTLLLDAQLAKKSLPKIDESMLPAIVAIKDGVAVNICPKLSGLTRSREDDSEIEERAVEHWLTMSGVLISQSPQYMDEICNIRPEEEALMDYLATQTPSKPSAVEEEQRYDCGLESCCKTFPHEHVGIKTSEQTGLVVKEETILGVGDDS